jgi:hypothetical protein
MDRLAYRLKIIVKVFFTYLFYLPGLVLHEGAHALAAIATLSKITDFVLIPRVKFSKDDSSYEVIYGYVNSVGSCRASYMLIGLAPFLLWTIPLLVANYFGWLNISTGEVFWEKMISAENWWFVILFLQIAWAGYPSSQDWKVFFHGLASVSGIVIIVGAILLARSEVLSVIWNAL